MMNLKRYLEQISLLTIFSIILTIANLLLATILHCDYPAADISGVIFLTGIVARIYIAKNKMQGKILADAAIIIGFIGYFVLISLC